MNQVEIARKLKISQTTVSLVLNNPSTSKVSKEKRQKIMDMMRNSNYLLKAHNGKTWNIGYVLRPNFNIGNSFYNRFFSGIQEGSIEAGYNVIVDNVDIRTSKLIIHRKVDGIILEDKLDIKTLNDLARKIPLVVLNDSIWENICDSVVPDNQGGIIKALDHLIEHGHSKIAFLGMLPPNKRIDGLLKDRKNMFENELSSRGFPINRNFIKTPAIKAISVEETKKTISETLVSWMKLSEAPTAVICSSDFNGALLLQAAVEKNIKVPEELSVIGTDNTDRCECTCPTLTSIDHNAMEMGRLAVELLLKRISNADRSFVRVSCASILFIRKSSGPLKIK